MQVQIWQARTGPANVCKSGNQVQVCQRRMCKAKKNVQVWKASARPANICKCNSDNNLHLASICDNFGNQLRTYAILDTSARAAIVSVRQTKV